MTNEEIRQKAIECSSEWDITACSFKCHSCEYHNPYGSCSAVYGYERGFADGVEEGKQLSTTWIPATERLPEDRRGVFVTAYWHETYQVMIGSYFGDGIWWCVPFNNCGEHMQKLNPIAWMPLPEPYKEEEA